MGVSSEILALIAKRLKKDVSKVTDEDVDVYLEGQKAGTKNNKDKEDESTPTVVDTAKTSAAFTSPAGPFVDIEQAAKGFAKSFSPEGIGESVDVLIKGAQGLGNNMGIGRARAAEFRAIVADACRNTR